ncbi:MAG: CoA ester lyase [Pseudomonadota bacterium]
MPNQHPHRSVLYMPGANPRALAKGRTLAADALILDLEDAVGPDDKPEARRAVAAALAEGGFGARRIAVRLNGADTPWGQEDLESAVAAGPHAILVPKVNAPSDIAAVAERIGDRPIAIWAMMETAAGMLRAAEIAAAPGLEAFVIGTNDLARELGCRFRPDRLPLLTGLGLAVLAARAEGLLCIDGVYNAFRDTEGLEQECLQGRDLGMDGKALIHPSQIETANRVFAPSADDIAEAEAVVAAFRAAGGGVAVLDGRIVENLHVEMAHATLVRAAAIATLEAESA